jgi:hypothetical protein
MYSDESKRKVEINKNQTDDTEKTSEARSAPKQQMSKQERECTHGTKAKNEESGDMREPLITRDLKEIPRPLKQNMVAAIPALCPPLVLRTQDCSDANLVQKDNFPKDFREFTRFVPLSIEPLAFKLPIIYKKLLEYRLGQNINTKSFTKEYFLYQTYSTLIVMWYNQASFHCGDSLRSQFGLHGHDVLALIQKLNLDVDATDQYTIDTLQSLIRPHLAPRIVETPTGSIREIPVIMVDVDSTTITPNRFERTLEDKYFGDRTFTTTIASHYYRYYTNSDVKLLGIPFSKWDLVNMNTKYTERLLAHLSFGSKYYRTQFMEMFRMDLMTEFCPILIEYLRIEASKSISQQGFSESPSEHTACSPESSKGELRNRRCSI